MLQGCINNVPYTLSQVTWECDMKELEKNLLDSCFNNFIDGCVAQQG